MQKKGKAGPSGGGGAAKPQKANWQDAFVKKIVGQDDMTMLSKVTNEDINENLKKRFEAGVIYVSDCPLLRPFSHHFIAVPLKGRAFWWPLIPIIIGTFLFHCLITES